MVIIVDSQGIVEFTDCRFIGNQAKAHITISVLNSNYTISVNLRFVNNTQFQEAP